ncbi:MAG: TspO/MBR family protein [Planctomycetota bacterium]
MPDTTLPLSTETSPDAPGAATTSARRDLLVRYGVLSFVLLGFGGWLTSLGMGPWYEELKKPPFQPPGWVFSPMWTVVLALLAVGTWRVARTGSDRARPALRLYAAQFALNVGWSLFFFTLANPLLALVDIVVLDVVLVAMVVAYGRVDRAAGWCIVPYAVWLAFATAINVWIVLNNG